MGTFSMWLHEQESRGDGVGEVARWWAGDAADRPRASSPSGISKWLDKQLREGSLAGIEQAEKDRMRIGFADAVNEYHDRDKPPDQSPALGEFMAETRAALRMLRIGQDRIMAALGLDTAWSAGELRAMAQDAAQHAELTTLTPEGQIELHPGHIEALRVRARLGEQQAQALLAAHGLGWGATAGWEPSAAEPAVPGPQDVQDELAAPGAGDRMPEPAGSLSAAQVIGFMTPDIAEFGMTWDVLHQFADHAGAEHLEGTPDDWAA